MYTVRTATKADLQSISLLINETYVKWFGNKWIKYDSTEIFKTYQTHRLIAEQGSIIVAYAEFRNYPRIGPLPSDNWMDWLYGRYW